MTKLCGNIWTRTILINAPPRDPHPSRIKAFLGNLRLELNVDNEYAVVSGGMGECMAQSLLGMSATRTLSKNTGENAPKTASQAKMHFLGSIYLGTKTQQLCSLRDFTHSELEFSQFDLGMAELPPENGKKAAKTLAPP